jgi:cytosine/adenosine deaminase-related metal-dependent hydrolase
MPYSLIKPAFAFAFAGRPMPRSLSASHQEAVELIRRYPGLTRPEVDRLAGLFPRLSSLDLSLMMADAELCPRVNAFCATHRAKIAAPWADLAVIGAILALPALLLLTFLLL